MDWIGTILAIAALGCSCFTVIIALGGFVVAAKQLKRLNRQVKQAASQITTSLSIEQNWKLFEHRDRLPTMLPSWSGLSDDNRGWAWRVLLLNHLDLLKMAYDERNGGAMDNDEFEAWKRRGRYWFHGMFREGANEEAVAGRNILRQILSREESTYTDGFCNWLMEAGILPGNP